MKKPAKLFATLAVAGVLALGSPIAANAYTPSGPESGTTTIVPGGSATITFTGFQPDEDVVFTLTGQNASGATLASVVAAVESISATKTADAEGAATVTVTLPTNAYGTYTLTADGQTSGASASTTLDTGVAAPEEDDSDNSLSPTGNDVSSLGLWVGGGALVLGGAAIVAATAVRRQRQDS